MKITENIYAIPLFVNRAFLVTGQKLLLIDTGMPHQARRIMRFIRKIGRDPKELAYIILTHHHIDHRGNARVLKAFSGASIAAHELDMSYIEGRKRAYREHPRLWVKLLFFITDLLFRARAAPVDRILNDGDIIGELQVIHTPGHTPGSISLYHEEKRVLFCGDTAPHTLGKLKKPNPYTIDHEQEKASLRKLASLECTFLLPNDCTMVLENAQSFLGEFCSKSGE